MARPVSSGSPQAIVLAALLALPGFLAAAPPDVTSEKIDGIPKGGNARIVATVGASAVSSARVYFRAEGEKYDYYLEMRRGSDGRYWAVTPVPKSETKGVLYRVAIKNASGVEGSTPVYSVPVSEKVKVKLTDEETRYATNLVIGQTEQGVPFLPPGWECTGVVSGITLQGELRPNDQCRATPASVWAAAGAGAALLASGAVITSPAGDANAPVSPSRPPSSSAPR